MQQNLSLAKDDQMNLEKLIRDKDNIVNGQTNEIERLRNELNEVKHQMQHCLADVKILRYYDYNDL